MRPVPHTARHSPLGLTRRGTEITEVITQRDSNWAIAERLMVSQRTVETHLSRIYRKLEVTSRTALAAQLTGRRTATPERSPRTTLIARVTVELFISGQSELAAAEDGPWLRRFSCATER